MPQAPVRVLIASRSPAWSAGITAFLSVAPLATVSVSTVDAALARMDAEPADLVVIDRFLGDGPGVELARELRRAHPDVRMLFAIDDASPESQVEALAAGATGCLLPSWSRDSVIEALDDALRGVGRFDVEALRPLADLARRAAPRDAALTDQERVVLRLMRQRLTYKEIAQRLGVSWHTVRTHAQSILRKTGVHSRRDLDLWDAHPGATVAGRGHAARA